jgi:hypothetical protein
MSEFSTGVEYPQYQNNPAFMSYLKQSKATSGRAPSAATLDQIIESELKSAAAKEMSQRQLSERKQEFSQNREDQNDAHKSATLGGVGSTLAQLGSQYYTTNKYADAMKGGNNLPTQPGIIQSIWDKGKGLFATKPPEGASGEIPFTPGATGVEYPNMPPAPVATSIGNAIQPTEELTMPAAVDQTNNLVSNGYEDLMSLFNLA